MSDSSLDVNNRAKDRQHRRSIDAKGSSEPRRSSSIGHYSESNKTEKEREKKKKKTERQFQKRRKWLKRQNAITFDDVETQLFELQEKAEEISLDAILANYDGASAR